MSSFKENDIRPEALREGMEKAIQEDISTLKKSKKNFERVSCPACGRDRQKAIFKKYSFNFDQCQHCRTVFMNPQPTPAILKEFYANSRNYEYWNKYIFPSSEKARREKIIKPRVKRINEICHRFRVPRNFLVEVGPGYGTFCEEVQKRGYFKKVIAIEPSPSCAASCRKRGVETIQKPIEEVEKLERVPNVIVSFEVIEHLYSPRDFILGCGRIMKPGSIVAVTCPNYEGFDIATLGVVSESIDHEHLNLFNTFSLPLLFEHSGFEVLECFTPGELDADIVRNKVLAGEFSLEGQNFLKTILVDRYHELGQKFQDFLRDNKLSSHMWLVARKK